MTSYHKFSPPNSHHARGLGLVELVICLTISALLLTATGTAYFSGFNTYRDNMSRGSLLNNGRNGLAALVRDIRMGDVFYPNDANTATSTNECNQFFAGTMPGYPTAGLPANGGSGVSGIIITKNHADSIDKTVPIDIRYWLDPTTNQLMIKRGTNTPSVLCPGVTDFHIYMQPVYIPYDPQTGAAGGYTLQRAAITLTLANRDINGNKIYTGGQTVTVNLTNSATPRRNFSMH